jgi:hypothetical protein
VSSQYERQIALLDPITSPPRNRPHQVLLVDCDESKEDEDDMRHAAVPDP